MGSIKVSRHGYVEKNLTELEIRQFAGWMAFGTDEEGVVPSSNYIDPIDTMQIRINSAPVEPIVKMTKKSYVDDFFDKGILQLGTVESFSEYEHAAIGDPEEGNIVLIGQHDEFTAFGSYGGDFDKYLYCTYIGIPQDAVLTAFEYDSGFTIVDPDAFSIAVQDAIGVKTAEYAECVYANNKALIGRIHEDYRADILDHQVIEMLESARCYIKPEKFSYQKELRLVWTAQSDLSSPILIECPDAVQYCHKL